MVITAAGAEAPAQARTPTVEEILAHYCSGIDFAVLNFPADGE